MPSDSKFTRDENGDIAVRVVTETEQLPASDPNWMFARDTNGNIAVRVVNGAGSGSDQHNLGWYATQAALEEAHPTAEAGDWAIVGATDTVWLWDTDNSEWVDSDQKGQVTSVNGQTGDVVLDLLPDQAGNAGKFLTTNGTVTSWGDETNSLTISGRSGVAEFGHLLLKTNDMSYMPSIQFVNNNGTINGHITGHPTTPKGLTIGVGSSYKHFDITESGIGLGWTPSVNQEVTLGNSDIRWTNVYTKKLNNGADIVVPAVAGSMATQVSSLPTAASTLEGQIYQYIGATDSAHINGHFYKCVSDGQDPATYSWEEVSLGGATYTAGNGISIDANNEISVDDPVLVNKATGSNSLAVLGHASSLTNTTNIGAYSNSAGSDSVSVGTDAAASTKCVSIGSSTSTRGVASVSIGYGATTLWTNNAIIINASGAAAQNTDVNTFKVANANGNFEIMSADGTVPTARLTKVNTTATLAVADWSSNTQTVSITGITADGVVFVNPTPANQSAYTDAGILCTAQAAGSLTFTCDTVPSADITVTVVML